LGAARPYIERHGHEPPVHRPEEQAGREEAVVHHEGNFVALEQPQTQELSANLVRLPAKLRESPFVFGFRAQEKRRLGPDFGHAINQGANGVGLALRFQQVCHEQITP